MNNFLEETRLLDFSNSSIQTLILENGWQQYDEKNKILAVYDFVRDKIKFGYNRKDELPASVILADGYGQCNTKSILFMALLRALRIPCRIHGFTIHRELQKGAISGIWYLITPKELIHSWVEVFYMQRWLNLEGFILDLEYINALQKRFYDCSGSFCGFGVATKDFKKLDIYWNEADTYIQNDGINKDYGVYDSPDVFFSKYIQPIHGVKKILYENVIRHILNNNVDKLRTV